MTKNTYEVNRITYRLMRAQDNRLYQDLQKSPVHTIHIVGEGHKFFKKSLRCQWSRVLTKRTEQLVLLSGLQQAVLQDEQTGKIRSEEMPDREGRTGGVDLIPSVW